MGKRLFAATLAGLLLSAPLAAADISSIDWTIAPARAKSGVETVQLGLGYRSSRGGESRTSRPWPLRDLQGLTAAQLASPSGQQTRFRIVREAGSLDCQGVVRQQRGTGDCDFTADPGFAATLERRGIGRPTRHDQLQLALHDVRLAVVSELERQGYARPTVADLVEAGIFGVTVPYLQSLDALGYRVGSMDELVKLRIHDVDAAYIRQLAAIGPRYRRLSADQLVAMRIHGVSPARVKEFVDLGYTDLTHDQLIQMSIHGVTPSFVREMAAAGYRKLSPDQLVTLRIHGVSAEMARETNAAVRTRN